MLTWRTEAGTKGRTAKQKAVQPMVGGMGSLTLERDESGIYPWPKFPANAHSITFIFFLHATYQEYSTVFSSICYQNMEVLVTVQRKISD